jgi:hypothetical protein
MLLVERNLLLFTAEIPITVTLRKSIVAETTFAVN